MSFVIQIRIMSFGFPTVNPSFMNLTPFFRCNVSVLFRTPTDSIGTIACFSDKGYKFLIAFKQQKCSLLNIICKECIRGQPKPVNNFMPYCKVKITEMSGMLYAI